MQFLSIDNNFYENKDPERDRKVIRELEKVLKERELWKVDMILETGSVPVIKSTYKPNGLKCKLGDVRKLCHAINNRVRTL